MRFALPIGSGVKRWTGILACAASCAAMAPAAHATATLDPSFGDAGVALTDFGGGDRGNGVAVQNDGRIVAAGYRSSSGSTWYDFIGQRLEPDGGALDTSFGLGGGFLTPMSPGAANDFGEDVALAPDGKVVVAGYTVPDGGHTGSLAVARYESDGDLDPAFGTGGKAIVSLAPDEQFEQYWAVAVRGDGKVLVAGGVRFGTSDDPIQLAVVRLTASGQLDTTFGDQGVARTLAGTSSEGFHLALAPDGGVLAAGFAVVGGVQVPLVVRLTAAGTLDSGFDGDGVLTLPGSLGGLAGGVDVASDGDVLVGLWRNSIASRTWGVARLDPSGALDTSFGGGDGSVTSTVASSDGGVIMEGLAIDSQGRVVVGGTAPGSRPAVARYTAAGAPDELFGPAGVVVDETATLLAGGFTLDAADRPLLSGTEFGDMAVARFTAGDAPAAPPADPPAPPAPASGGPAAGAPAPSAGGGPPHDAARPVVKLVVKRDVVLGPTIGFSVRADEATHFVATLEVSARDARRAGIARRARPVVIARARASLAAAGSRTLRFRLRAGVRRRLARRPRVGAVLRIVARDRAGNLTRLNRPVRLRAR